MIAAATLDTPGADDDGAGADDVSSASEVSGSKPPALTLRLSGDEPNRRLARVLPKADASPPPATGLPPAEAALPLPGVPPVPPKRMLARADSKALVSARTDLTDSLLAPNSPDAEAERALPAAAGVPYDGDAEAAEAPGLRGLLLLLDAAFFLALPFLTTTAPPNTGPYITCRKHGNTWESAIT